MTHKAQLPRLGDLAPEGTLVGQAFTVLDHYSTCLIACGCEARTPLLLVGVGSEVQCPACQRSFGLAKAAQLLVGEIKRTAVVV